MSSTDQDPAARYRGADRRLRQVLFGDETYSAGTVRGEEPRRLALRELRLMREAFDALAERVRAAARAESRVADLEEELRAIAASRTRARQASGRATKKPPEK